MDIFRYFTIGPMTRYASDLKPFLKAMAGPDITKLPKIDAPVDFKNLKVFYMLDDMNPTNTRVQKKTQDSIQKLVAHLESKGSIAQLRALLNDD